MITILMQDGENHFGPAFQISRGGVIAIASIIVAVILALYVLRSIGIYVLAKRQQVKFAFLAWIPFVWMYTTCKIIGKVRIFGSTFARCALIFTIIFAVAEALVLTYEILTYYPLIGNLLIGGKKIFIVDNAQAYANSTHPVLQYRLPTGIAIFHDSSFAYPFSLSTELAIVKTINVLSYISIFLEIASMVVLINVYIALFRKFWPQHFILASILSFLGIFAPFVFAIRKKNPINYQEYLRARYGARYGAYGGPYQNPYGNPYGNPYQNQGNPYGQRQTPPEHPFSEFAERGEVDPGDPFKEFSNKDKEPFSEYDKKDKDE